MKLVHGIAMFCATIGFAVLIAGCSQKENDKGADKQAAKKKKGDTKKKDDHSGWWCAEHGVPEDKCSLCSNEAAENFKSKGDWCELHDRAKSQCFKCDPKLYERFEAMYRAKYGKAPPRPPESEFQK